MAKQNLMVLVLTGLALAVAIHAEGQASSTTQTPATAPAKPAAQTPGTQNTPPPNEPVRRGGFVPGQKRPPGDPAQIAHGKTLYAVNCRGCHGADLRGGDMGGPNLLRSQVALSDQNGEAIIPIIHGSRQKMGMPAIGLDDASAAATAAYVRSVIATIEKQGAPPSGASVAPNVLVGNASEGKAFFAAKCSGCHTAESLRGVVGRTPDPKHLQNAWISGGTREEENSPESSGHSVTATVTLPSGEKVGGKLLRIDEFEVSVQLPDKTERTFRRTDEVPTVEIHDPLKGHRDLLPQYSNKDIHDVTAYLVTLK